MEEDQAHAYYVDLKNKGSGAAMFKEGLGFDKGGPGSTNQGHIQFVAQKQDNHMTGQAPDPQSRQVLSGDSNPWQSAIPAQSQQPQTPHAQQRPPQGFMQQQAPHWGPNGISQQSARPPAAGLHQPIPGQATASPAGMGSAVPRIGGHPPAGPSGPMLGPPPQGPAIAWSGSPDGPPAPHMMGPGGRGMPPRGLPNGPPGMPPGMHPGMLGRGLPPGMHARPPPGMRPPGVMQGFPGGGPPPGFPPQRPSMATLPRPPQGWGQPQQGSPRPPQMMPHPMHRPPPQHPGSGPQQMHLLRPPHNQQGSHLRPMLPQHPIPQQLPPQQHQQHLQSPGNMLSPRPGHTASPGPQAIPQARPTVPTQLNGMRARPVTQAAPLQQLEARFQSGQPAMATHKPTTGGWMAHKSGDGQVYYHNTSTGESSWQKPEGFEGNAAAGKGTPTPASSEEIPLTGWSEVTCTDGRKYYYHAEREETSWSKPPEVAAALAKAIKAGANKKAGMTADQVAIIARLKANNAQLNLRPELQEAEEPEEDNDDVTFTDQDIGQPEAVTHAQPPQNPPLPSSLPPMPGGPPMPMQFPGAYPPQPAMQVPPLPAARSHDALVQDFKDLLLESKVTPFSRWERELPKLVGDSRYKAIDKPKERRQIFDDFCRNVAEEQNRSKERKERQAAAAEAAFLALLDEAQAWSEEDHEEPGSSNTDMIEDEDAAEKPYNDLRVIRRALTAATQTDQMEAAWGHDPRWQGIDSKVGERLLVARIDQLQADVKQVEEATKAAQEQAFRALLKETKVSASSRYSKVREDLRGDERYKAMSSSQREAAFKLYQADLKEGEEVVRKQEQETADRDTAAKKAEADAKRRQREAAHNDAVAAFQTLLAETVKDSSARWQDWKIKLGKDPQGRADNKAFAPREQQSLFEKYVKELGFQIEQDFRSLMDQMLRPMLPPEPQAKTRPAPLATFEAASALLESDLRWDRVAERDRERLWRGYVRDIVHERDHPQQHNRLAASSRAAERDKGRSAKDVGDVVDKAYLREYIEPDQKRVRRE